MKKEHAFELLDSYLPSLRAITIAKDGIELRTVGAVDIINKEAPHNFSVFVYLHPIDGSECISRVTIGEYAHLAAVAILKAKRDIQ